VSLRRDVFLAKQAGLAACGDSPTAPRGEQADHPVLAIITTLRFHLAAAHAVDSLRQPFAARSRNILQISFLQDKEFRAKPAKQPHVLLLHAGGSWTDAQRLANHLRQRNQAGVREDSCRPAARGPVRQFLHAMHHPDRDFLPTDRAQAAMCDRGLWLPNDATGTVAIEVILALFGEELDRAPERAHRRAVRLPAQRGKQRSVRQLSVEQRRLACQLLG